MLDPAKVGKDQNRVVGGDTGISVPHTSHVFDRRTKKNFVVMGVSLVV